MDQDRRRVLGPEESVEVLEAKLAQNREKVHEEMRRNLVALAELRAEEAFLQSELKAARETVRRLLPQANSARTVPGMRQSTINDRHIPDSVIPRGTPGRVSRSEHPFVVWLISQGSSIQGWATAHGLKRSRVKGWVTEDTDSQGFRRIPLAYAKIIERDAGKDEKGNLRVPANFETWPRGFLDGPQPNEAARRKAQKKG